MRHIHRSRRIAADKWSEEDEAARVEYGVRGKAWETNGGREAKRRDALISCIAWLSMSNAVIISIISILKKLNGHICQFIIQ